MTDCVESVSASSFLQAGLEPLIGSWLYADSLWWTVLGFAGAAVFGSRFLLQWLSSEKAKTLIVPWYFWHLSFWGSCLNLLYALHLDKAPLIAGTIALPLMYGRNLVLLNRGGRKDLRHQDQRPGPRLAVTYSESPADAE